MGVCIDVPAKRGRSQDTARQACRMRKIMVVLPITRSVAQNRFRGGGGNRGELYARIHTLAGLGTQFEPPDHDTPTIHNEIRNCLGHGVFG